MDQFNLQQNYKPMTIGDWLITFLIQIIPLVGFVMLFVWAFGGDTHPSKKNLGSGYLAMVCNNDNSVHYFLCRFMGIYYVNVWRNGFKLFILIVFSYSYNRFS